MDRFSYPSNVTAATMVCTMSVSAGLPSPLIASNLHSPPPLYLSQPPAMTLYPKPLPTARLLCRTEPGVLQFTDTRRAMCMDSINKWSDLTKDKDCQVGLVACVATTRTAAQPAALIVAVAAATARVATPTIMFVSGASWCAIVRLLICFIFLFAPCVPLPRCNCAGYFPRSAVTPAPDVSGAPFCLKGVVGRK